MEEEQVTLCIQEEKKTEPTREWKSFCFTFGECGGLRFATYVFWITRYNTWGLFEINILKTKYNTHIKKNNGRTNERTEFVAVFEISTKP